MKKAIIIAVITLVTLTTGLNNVKAVELELSVNQSNVCVDNHGTQICGGYKDNPYDDNISYPLELIKYRVKTGTGFKADSTYTFNIGYKPTPDAIHPKEIQFQFSNGNSYETNFKCNEWNLNSVGYYRTKCDFTPSMDVNNTEYLYIYVKFYPGYLTTIRPSLLTKYNIVEGVGSIIKDQTNQIIEEQEKTNDILTGEHDYNREPSEKINGKEDIDNYTEKEEELFNNLNFEGIGNNEITINGETSNFIWRIVERIREISGKIQLLMTSVLGLGIIKMVLNR